MSKKEEEKVPEDEAASINEDTSKEKDQDSMKNKRKDVRVEPQEKGKSDVRLKIGGENLELVDISSGGVGAYFVSDVCGFKIDEEFTLSLYLPTVTEKNVEVKGKVKHIRSKHFGVAFVDPSERSVEIIDQYIDKLLDGDSTES